jgi:hypothetical protein
VGILVSSYYRVVSSTVTSTQIHIDMYSRQEFLGKMKMQFGWLVRSSGRLVRGFFVHMHAIALLHDLENIYQMHQDV